MEWVILGMLVIALISAIGDPEVNFGNPVPYQKPHADPTDPDFHAESDPGVTIGEKVVCGEETG